MIKFFNNMNNIGYCFRSFRLLCQIYMFIDIVLVIYDKFGLVDLEIF